MDFRSVIARTITRVERPRNEHGPVAVVSTALGGRRNFSRLVSSILD